MNGNQADNIRQAALLLQNASRVCFLTGAGVSAESGVATFRGPDGLWEGRRAEEVATPEAFAVDPEDVWRFYNQRRQRLAKVGPNAGHHAMAGLDEFFDEVAVITQNIDGLHRLAGSSRVIELHGNLWVNRCTRQDARPNLPPCPETRTSPEDDLEAIPRCAACGSMMRPAVVWFGEMLPVDAFNEARDAAARCQVMIVAGTSAVVQPAASIAPWAAMSGAKLIEVNPNETPLSGEVDLCLRGPSGEVLPAVVDLLRELQGHP